MTFTNAKTFLANATVPSLASLIPQITSCFKTGGVSKFFGCSRMMLSATFMPRGDMWDLIRVPTGIWLSLWGIGIPLAGAYLAYRMTIFSQERVRDIVVSMKDSWLDWDGTIIGILTMPLSLPKLLVGKVLDTKHKVPKFSVAAFKKGVTRYRTLECVHPEFPMTEVPSLPKCMVSVMVEGEHCGFISLIKRDVNGNSERSWLTSYHVVLAARSKGPHLVLNNGERECQTPFSELECERRSIHHDFIEFGNNAKLSNAASVLGVKAARVGVLNTHAMVRVYSPPIQQGSSYLCSTSIAKQDKMGRVVYKASTAPGSSGGPIFQSSLVVGIHCGGSDDEDGNVLNSGSILIANIPIRFQTANLEKKRGRGANDGYEAGRRTMNWVEPYPDMVETTIYDKGGEIKVGWSRTATADIAILRAGKDTGDWTNADEMEIINEYDPSAVNEALDELHAANEGFISTARLLEKLRSNRFNKRTKRRSRRESAEPFIVELEPEKSVKLVQAPKPVTELDLHQALNSSAVQKPTHPQQNVVSTEMLEKLISKSVESALNTALSSLDRSYLPGIATPPPPRRQKAKQAKENQTASQNSPQPLVLLGPTTGQATVPNARRQAQSGLPLPPNRNPS